LDKWNIKKWLPVLLVIVGGIFYLEGGSVKMIDPEVDNTTESTENSGKI